MNRDRLDNLLSLIRSARTQTLAELAVITELEFDLPTSMQRWTDLRRVLLRFGDHMREHTNQIEGVRVAIACAPTMPQRMLAEGEIAWGKLLAATLGLTDDDIVKLPPDGGWSVEHVMEHILQLEQEYLTAIRTARAANSSRTPD